MVTANINVNVYPFQQQLLLTIIEYIVPSIMSIVLIIVLFKYMPKLMYKIYNRNNMSYKDYNCKCGRCQYELRTKKGVRLWKRYHKYKRDDLK